jgi:hypothetical protein
LAILNANAFLFERDVVGQFRQHVADLVKAETDLNHKHDATAIERAMATADAFLQLAREELGVVRRAEPIVQGATAKK